MTFKLLVFDAYNNVLALHADVQVLWHIDDRAIFKLFTHARVKRGVIILQAPFDKN
jgi:hypothetical protein